MRPIEEAVTAAWAQVSAARTLVEAPIVDWVAAQAAAAKEHFAREAEEAVLEAAGVTAQSGSGREADGGGGDGDATSSSVEAAATSAPMPPIRSNTAAITSTPAQAAVASAVDAVAAADALLRNGESVMRQAQVERRGLEAQLQAATERFSVVSMQLYLILQSAKKPTACEYMYFSLPIHPSIHPSQ